MSREVIMWLMMGVYAAIIIVIGWLGYKRTKSRDDFFVAGRSVGLFAGAAAFGSAFVSASSMLAFTGFAYVYGWSIFPARLLAFGVGWSVLMIVGGWFRQLGKVSLIDFLTSRYYDGKVVRVWAAIAILSIQVVSLVVQFMGIGKVFNQITGLSYAASVVIVGILVILYVCMGGMKAVVWTDVFQYIIFFAAACTIAMFCYANAGWVDSINSIIAGVVSPKNPVPGGMLNWNAGLGAWTIIGLAVSVATQIPSTPNYIQLASSTKDPRTSRLMFALGSLLTTGFYVALFYSGIASRAIIGDVPSVIADPDTVMLYMLRNLFPPVLAGFVLSAMAAAIMSTVDVVLLSAGTTLSHDIYSNLINPNATESQSIKVATIGTMVVGGLAILGAAGRLFDMFWLGTFSAALYGASFFFPIILGFCWPRATKEGMIASSVGGWAVTVLATVFKQQWLAMSGGIPEYFPGLAVAIVLLVAVSLLTPEPPERVLKEFFPQKLSRRNVASA